ncbi:MAG: EAL domain-containing protein [Idiomarina sp.]|nr:EAL domain-containing protein [Idiomarina sp.]
MQRYSHFRLAILTAVGGILLTLTIAIFLYVQDNRQIRQQLSQEVVELQQEIIRQLQNHMFGLTWIARHNARNQGSADEWREEAPIVINSYPHFRCLLWLDDNQQLLSGYSIASTTNFSEVLNQSDYRQVIAGILPGQRAMIPAGPMGRDYADITLVAPLTTAAGTHYYLGVLDIQDLLQTTVDRHIDRRSFFRLTSQGSDEIIFQISESDQLRERWGGHIDFTLFDDQWRMELWPSSTRLNAMRSWLPLLIVLAGLVTTALLTFVLYVLGISRVRAQELADTNIDLYVEIEERERVEKRMAYLAEHDWLTDLANRNALMERLEEFFQHAAQNKCQVGALFIDLDNFKEANDALGHSVGDQLLKRVASRLHKLAPQHSCLARMGGDEYVLAIANIKDIDELKGYADKVLDALDTHFYVDDYEMFISASIGVALGQPGIDSAENLIRNADTALYRAKESGRNSYHVYSEILHRELNQRMELMKRLRYAVEHQKLAVFYQPKVDMHSRRIIGAEALVRWIDEDGSIIGPDKFIPIAEDTGLIIPISEFVLKTACKQLAAWHSLGFNELTMAVNLSGKQLQSPDLVSQIMSVVNDTGIPASHLELELTEQVFIENIQSHTNFMHAIRERGISLAIDDFGVGYSSLSYLKHFPVTALKIDRSFVQDLPHDKDDATLTQTIINLAKSLDIGLVAEGVETEAQVEFLLDRECTVGQGYLFSRPIPADEFTQLLDDYQGQIPIQIM